MCIFSIPHTFVSDNGKQFDNSKFKRFCASLGITNAFSSPTHPQANGQAKIVNKIINFHLKTRLKTLKKSYQLYCGLVEYIYADQQGRLLSL